MLRVVRILNRFNLGGPTYNAAYLTKYMDKNFETLLVGGINDNSEKNSEYIVKKLGIDPVTIPLMRRGICPLYDYMAYNSLKNIIRKFKPHIVHTHASKAGALGRFAASSLDVPVIVHTFHGHIFDAYFDRMKTSFYKSIERKLAKKSSGIIAIRKNQKNDLVNKYNICEEEKVKVIPLGFELEKFKENANYKRFEFRSKYNIKDDEIAIGIIGRLVPIKNHKLFLNSIKLLKENTGKKFKAFIIGDGEMREHLKDFSTKIGLSYTSVNGNGYANNADIIFTSWLTEMDKANAGMDIIALTSLNEGTPVSLIEAQASKKPIVTTSVGGINDVILPDKTALISKNDAEDFSNKLLKLVENKDLRDNLSEEGWEHVKCKFHYTRLVSEMSNYYYDLLDKAKVNYSSPIIA